VEALLEQLAAVEVEPLVAQRDGQALVEERHLLQPAVQRLAGVGRRLAEDVRVGPEGEGRPRLVRRGALQQRLRHGTGVRLRPDPAVTADLYLHAGRQRVDHRGPDAVQTA
jgi:hypothetical protein